MLLDSLISHLQDLREIHGGKVHIKIEVDIYDGCSVFQTNDLTVLKTEDYISIRNF